MKDRWSRTDLTRWLEGVALVSEPWLGPLLAELGIPQSIALEPEDAWRICRQAVTSDTQAPVAEDRQIRLFVLRVLESLAVAYTEADANILQAWVEKNFVSRRRPIGLLLWRRLLVRACTRPLDEESGPPPDSWRWVLPTLCDHLDEFGVERLDAALRARAPSVTPDDEELGLDVPREVLVAGEVARNDRTAEAMRTLASLAADAQVDGFIGWVDAQTQALGLDVEAFDPRLFLHLDQPDPDEPPALRLA